MAIDTAEKRKSISGIPLLIPGVTSNLSKDAEWRAQSGWSYSGLIAVSPTPIVTPTVENPDYVTVYEALASKFNNISPDDLNLSGSGFLLENTKLPYVSLVKTSNVLDWRDSCLKRYEKSLYQFLIYAETQDEILDLIIKINNVYDFSTLRLRTPKRFTNLEWMNEKITELTPQLFRGIIAYEITVEKSLTDRQIIDLETKTISDNFLSAIYNRYKSDELPDLNTARFTLNSINLPYIVIPSTAISEDHRTSKSRIEKLAFQFDIFSESLQELESLQNDITNIYDYCKLRLDNKWHTMFEWVSDTAEELNPQIWKGSVNYEILMEKYI